MRIGILTGGGDAPGLNGIIESTCKILLKAGVEVIGILDGFEGIFQGKTKSIHWGNLEGLHSQAGTYLGTSNKSKIEGREELFQKQFDLLKLDGMIVAGGDGTFLSLKKLSPNAKIIGVPKTIDNDLQGTEQAFGYDTACTVVAESVDALRATAEAHNRVMVVETMGRSAGWIALGAGLASYADAILIPERPYSRAKLKEFLADKKNSGRKGLILVIAESARALDAEESVIGKREGGTDTKRYGGVGERLSSWISENTEWESRHVVLGPLQRSRSPTVFDRMLTQNLGELAAELALKGSFDVAVVYRDGKCEVVPIQAIQGEARTVPIDHPLVSRAEKLGIFL